MAALHQFLDILLKPDNIPIAGMLILVLFFTWVALRQALRNDRLIEQGREDEVLKEMQRSFRVVPAPGLCYLRPQCRSRSSPRTAPAAPPARSAVRPRRSAAIPKKALLHRADALHRLRRVRRDLPRRGHPRHLRQRHQGAEAPGASDRDRPPGQLQRLRRLHRRLPVRLHLAVARTTRRSYLGRVEVNEKTCVGCKLCEEVCGWEGIYIMPGREKQPFLESLGYDVDDADGERLTSAALSRRSC